jgi:dGTPase
VALWQRTREQVAARIPDADPRVQRAQIIVALVNLLVTDLVEQTARAVAERGITSPEQVRDQAPCLAGFSNEIQPLKADLKRFLHHELYLHPKVVETNRQAEDILGDLYRALRRDPGMLPEHVVARFGEEGEARAIADYLAGMTDRFALAEHEKLRSR